MKQTQRRANRLGILLLAAMTNISSLLAAEGLATTGRLLLSSGSVHTVSADGEEQVLARRADMLPGQILRTGPDGCAQIMLQHGLIVKLGSDTEVAFLAPDTEKTSSRKATIDLKLNKGLAQIMGEAATQPVRVRFQNEKGDAPVTVEGTFYGCQMQGDTLNVINLCKTPTVVSAKAGRTSLRRALQNVSVPLAEGRPERQQKAGVEKCHQLCSALHPCPADTSIELASSWNGFGPSADSDSVAGTGSSFGKSNPTSQMIDLKRFSKISGTAKTASKPAIKATPAKAAPPKPCPT